MSAPDSSADNRYDVIIIGCGMAGLAAGIRLAMYDKSVLILEKHNAPGGLNSFYFLGGRKCDVGLHAVTNYVDPGVKGTPLVKLLRQLRISRDEFELCPQLGSRIQFPGVGLDFSNDFQLLEAEVAKEFPKSVDGFRSLRQAVSEFNPFDLGQSGQSARAFIRQHIQDDLLEDMILCPLFYYGSAREDDMDADQFVIMWRALFEEGFARPYEGVRVIIRSLINRFREVGGKRRMKCGVNRIISENGKAVGVELETGEALHADQIISTAGLVETGKLCDDRPEEDLNQYRGKLSFVETMSFMDVQPRELGWDKTIIFFNDAERLHYRCPEEPVDPRSGVICFPNNYRYPDGQELDEGILRVTSLANYKVWADYEEEKYYREKEAWFSVLQEKAIKMTGSTVSAETLEKHTQFKDMFSPTTVTKYTSHLGGAIYGASEKYREGKTHLDNLYLAGTDQGFLGIIGAMLSGISMANAHVLRGS